MYLGLLGLNVVTHAFLTVDAVQRRRRYLAETASGEADPRSVDAAASRMVGWYGLATGMWLGLFVSTLLIG